MDLLLLILLVLVLLSVGGWGYTTYGPRGAPVGDAAVAPAGFVSPMGILALILIVAMFAVLFTGWRPLGPVW